MCYLSCHYVDVMRGNAPVTPIICTPPWVERLAELSPSLHVMTVGGLYNCRACGLYVYVKQARECLFMRIDAEVTARYCAKLRPAV